jgi:EXLDI family protein
MINAINMPNETISIRTLIISIGATGRKVARWREGNKSEPTYKVFQLYLTQKGQFALHMKITPNIQYGSKHQWKNLSGPDSTEIRWTAY